jgi:lipopolysaccharide/colanic/teichoic acid biosynthesis glycosyltransferase
MVLKRAADVVVSTLSLLIVGPVAVLTLARATLAGNHDLLESHTVYTAGGGQTRLWLLRASVTGWLPVRGAPALVSVVLGRFSLIGPRPTPCDEHLSAEPGLWATAVKPGLLGPWRLSGPQASLDDQALQDLTYVRNYSVWEDLRIAWQSVRRMLGSRQRLGRWQDRPGAVRQSDWLDQLDTISI